MLEIPRIVSLAWRTATLGTPGPVVLDFPIDVLFTPVEVERVAWGNITAPLCKNPGPDLEAIKELAALLKSAERPVVIVGTGAQNVSEVCSNWEEKSNSTSGDRRNCNISDFFGSSHISFSKA